MGPFPCLPFSCKPVILVWFTAFSESVSMISSITLLLVRDWFKVFLFHSCSLLIIKSHFWRTHFIKSFLITPSQGPFNLQCDTQFFFIVSYKIYNYFLWGVKVKGKVLWSVQFSLIHNIVRPRYTLTWFQTNFHNYAKYSFASVKPKCQTLTSPALLLQVVFHEITDFVPPRSWADIAILV